MIIIREEASPDALLTDASLLSPAKSRLRKPSRHFIVYNVVETSFVKQEILNPQQLTG